MATEYWTEERRKERSLNNPARRPENRLKIREGLKQFHEQNPNFAKKVASQPAWRKKVSANSKRQWETKREKMMATVVKAAQRPEAILKRVASRKELHKLHPERKEYYRCIDRSYMQTSEYKLACSVARKSMLAKNPEYQKCITERIIEKGRKTAVDRGKNLKQMYADGKIKKKYGLDNCMSRPEVVRKVFSKISCKPNGLENWFIELFQANHLPIEYVGNAKLVLKTRKGSRIPDFKVKGTNKLIEVGSPPWHSESEFQERAELFREIGFECKTLLVENCKRVILNAMQDTFLNEIRAFIQ